MPEAETTALLGPAGVAFMGVYLVSLVGLGVLGRRARRDHSMADYYLAGRGLGLTVLFLTLFATQYSGNTMIGYPGKAYRDGYQALVLIPLMMSIVGAYLVYAPRLYRRSQRRGYITIGDYVQDRFGSTLLTVLISVSCMVALANFVLTNLKAIGYVVEAASGGVVTAGWGIAGLALVMVVYETLGGLRSVAWTDAIQGTLLLLGCATLFGVIWVTYGGVENIGGALREARPDFAAVPTPADRRLWISTLLIGAFGASVYPHAIQRIYAARDARVLRRSIQWMALMPLVTTLFMVVVGLVGSAQFPGLARAESDQVILLLLGDVQSRIPWTAGIVVLFLSAAVAAIMSTVDSALLALSSLFTQDLYRRVRNDAGEARLTRVGKLFSWAVMAFMAALATALPQTIWRLLEIKLELLCQIAPAVFLGLHLRRLPGRAVLAGFVAGTIVALALMIGNVIDPMIPVQPWGVHAGIWGLGVNLAALALMTVGSEGRRAEPVRRVAET